MVARTAVEPVMSAQFHLHRVKVAAAVPTAAVTAARAAAERKILSVTMKNLTAKAIAVTQARCQAVLVAWVAKANA